jgi:hypothetical protein
MIKGLVWEKTDDHDYFIQVRPYLPTVGLLKFNKLLGRFLAKQLPWN